MRIKKIVAITALILAAAVFWFYFYHKKTSNIPTQQKILITASTSYIKSLDPIHGVDDYSARELAKVYEGLLEYHYLKRPLELVPNLAESMPTVSDDQLVYTFKIKPGVLFHDNVCFANGKGRELTADDFVYSLKRLADPKNSPSSFWVIDGKIKGLMEWREKYIDAEKVDYTDNIEGIKALDRYTLQFILTHPYPQFLHVLAMVVCMVVPYEAVEYYGIEFMNHPVGTGPFTAESFNPQDTKIIYHKNLNFRDKFFPSEAAEEYQHMLTYAGKKLPFVDTVITHIIPEEQPRWLMFKKGEIDILDLTVDKTIAEIIDSNNHLMPSLQIKGMQLLQVPSVCTNCIVFNNSLELFKNNPKLRQAISLAFDTATYNKLFYKNGAILAQSILPPGLAGYQKGYVNFYRSYNIKKAKQYLEEAGYPGGKGLPTLTLDVANGTVFRQRGEFFQKCMNRIGIKVKLIENIFPELLKKVANKATMLHTMSWSIEYPDAQSFFHLFYGPYGQPGLGTYFNDLAFNALYEKASLMSDSPDRTTLYERLNQMIAEQLPVIPLVHPKYILIQHGWVKNYCYSDSHRGTEQYFDIDLGQKAVLKPKLKE